MAGKRVTVTYKVVDEFSQPQAKYAAGVKAAEQATKSLQRSAGDRGTWGQAAFNFNELANSAIKIYSAFTQVFSIADQWADMGVGAERNKIALQSLTGAGKEYEDQVRAIIDATRGAVTEGEAAGYAYRLQRFGLAETSDEMERFMRTVSIVSAINPQLGGTAEAINQIQLTLSNMSFMRLDQLGISAGQVRQRMEELGKAQKDLSTEEKFQIAVMEQLDEQANAVGDSILEMTDAQDRMKARWKGFKEDWGLKIAEGFEAIAQSAEGAAIAIDKVGYVDFVKETGKQLMITGGEVAQTARYAAGIDELVTGNLAPAYRRQRIYRPAGMDQGFFEPPASGGSEFSTPLIGPVEGDYSAYYARQQQQDFYSHGRPQTGFRQQMRGVGTMAGQEFGDFAGQAQEVIDLLPLIQTGFSNVAGAIADGQSTLGQMVTDADTLANMSLAEFWGTGASAFDSDVYSEMTQALSDAGIEGEAAAAAIQAYQINTGMANASSEIFRDNLADLSEKFRTGQMTAAEYALAVGDLARQDFSWADKVAQSMANAGDLQGAIEYIEALKNMTPESWQAFNTLGTAMSEGIGNMQNILFGGGGEDTEMVPGLTVANEELDVVLGKVSLLALEGPDHITTFTDAGAASFTAFSDSAVSDLDRIQGNAAKLNGLRFSVFMDVIPTLMGGVGGGTPVVPGGGSPNVAPNIVPTGTAPVTAPTINATIEIDKKVIAEAVIEADRITGRR